MAHEEMCYAPELFEFPNIYKQKSKERVWEWILKVWGGTFLVVQWLRIRLPMQGMQVQSLVGKLGSHMLQGY